MHAVGGQVELGRERGVAAAELEGFGDGLVVDGLVALPEGGRALLDSDEQQGGRHDCQHGQDGDGAPAQHGGAALLVARGGQEIPRRRGEIQLVAAGPGAGGLQAAAPVQH